MERITIGFSKAKSPYKFGSLILRTYMRTPYSHVYIKFHSEKLNRVLIYEAVGSGVRFIGKKSWNEHSIEVASYDIKIKQCNYIHLMQYCVDHAGYEYGFLQNIGIFISESLNIKNNYFKKGKNCSEIIAEILSIEGYDIKKDFNLITPKDIHDLLYENKSIR